MIERQWFLAKVKKRVLMDPLVKFIDFELFIRRHAAFGILGSFAA